ncbi:2-phospho-L-lactate guanylyltransferase CofC [Segniliparus rotundus DSM 44985]|uniref:Phosphoenolpyruvate guanylyltransferase n=1 Tax=Segniliparus rotundus (strain ATCC BAA-972 / CDC 1076 / CIP 108378 / DSM 44985 / JCM 13578) TaxID=640132 RepID=D6ZET7_SEGRD|nr:2-phospho-L-lactate guanylyltransferase [Segniliparus rotundus]ADG97461.1 2-phospho-L-lactate guanylyltransferase CofC [Segniliparus rotundus DSM 44985]
MVFVSRPAAPHAVVLIAVKPLREAKTRLAPALRAEQRAQLTLAMLTDVLEAARGAAWTRAVAVITADPQAGALARAYGAVVLDEPEPESAWAAPTSGARAGRAGGGLNAALRAGDAWAREQFPTALRAALHGDLPALRPGELQEALRAARGRGRSYVADHAGLGTTALIAADPAEQLAPVFGPGSAARHEASGATAITEPLPGLRHDVDVPDDLRMTGELGLGLATKALLAGVGLV